MGTITHRDKRSMNITVNGRPRTIDTAANLKTLIERSCRDTRHVIAEVNGAIVKNPHWENQPLKNGDVVELVHFVGGG